jgi:DNA-directed RNA polymerase specialized sigma subunit
MFSLARKALVQVIMPVRAPFYVFLSAVVLRRCWSGSPLTQHRNGGHIMFNRKSSYALNKKDPNAIVYMDANEAIIRLTREDFASEEEFLKWKSLSDADYHASEKEDHVYANHTLALDELSEEAASIPAADVCMEQAHDRVAEIRRSTQKVTQIRKHLTDTQFRRMWMYFVDGMTIDEIGKVEGVSHQAISLNITAAIRKIKKYF